MSLRDQIQQLAVRDSELDEHHLNVHRVDRSNLHPPRVETERLSRNNSAYGAKAVVEDFHARIEQRQMRQLDQEPVSQSDGSPPDVNAPVLLEEQGVKIHKCAYDARGITEVICSADDFKYDLPIFIVNPPLLVEDPNGDIEMEVGEDENGDPIIGKFREDPTQAMLDILVDLKNEGEQ